MFDAITNQKPWVSFCISTYLRPEFLALQLDSLCKQTFKNFEVIISDNDPYRSAESIVNHFNDQRFKYFNNGANLGMILSFNNSIDRASADYIVMVTDDDPIEEIFLFEMYNLYTSDPSCSLYAGFSRKKLAEREIEKVQPENFISEILDLRKTPYLLWSSCVMRKTEVLAAGKMPDFGSPHFADHALIAMVGSINGGLIINKVFSRLASHENNFSKSNFHFYLIGCEGFYQLMNSYCKKNIRYDAEMKAVVIHLGMWFFGCIFTLKKYFTLHNNNEKHKEIVECAHQILALSYMKKFRFKYYAKSLIFIAKKQLGFLKL